GTAQEAAGGGALPPVEGCARAWTSDPPGGALRPDATTGSPGRHRRARAAGCGDRNGLVLLKHRSPLTVVGIQTRADVARVLRCRRSDGFSDGVSAWVAYREPESENHGC